MRQPTPHSPSPASRDSVDAIIGEFIAVKKQEKAEEIAAEQAGERRKKRPILAAFAVIVCAAIWILPSFLMPQNPPPTPERLEAGARVTIYLASERIRTFQQRSGRLPDRLSDAGVDSNGLSYRKSSAVDFELSTEVNGARLQYRSTTPPTAFLGSAYQILTAP